METIKRQLKYWPELLNRKTVVPRKKVSGKRRRTFIVVCSKFGPVSASVHL